jgi:pathogenesis-related protein 1
MNTTVDPERAPPDGGARRRAPARAALTASERSPDPTVMLGRVLLALWLIAAGCVDAGDDGLADDQGDGDADDGDEGDADDGDDDGDDGDGGADEPEGLDGTTAAHNQVRAAHGVDPLSWDPELAAIAQGWAEQCVDFMDPIGLIDHNPGRSDTYPDYVGENVFGSSGPTSGLDAVALWVAEEANYDYETNQCSGVCGHYTQVVWAATTMVGCGIHTCPGLTYGHSIVCNYAPAGNDGGWPY